MIIQFKDQNSFNRGKSALMYFHNRALKYSDYKLSFLELQELLSFRTSNKYFIEGLGDGIILGEISEFNVKAGMETLADQGKGKIPSTNGAFTQAIANNVRDNISYVSAFAYVATESSKDILEGATAIGDSVMGIGKFLNSNLFWVLPLGILVVVYVNAKARV